MDTNQAPDHETILLVDDDSTTRTVLRTQLEQEGYNVLEASNGNVALAVSERHSGPIHMLLTDLMMPRMSGLELSQRLAAVRKGLRVLCISAYVDDSMVRAMLQYSRIDFMAKATTSLVVRKVRELLNAS